MENILLTDDVDFNKYLDDNDAVEKVRPAALYFEKIIELIDPPEGMPQHPKMPFTGCDVYFQPGEVTLWAGYNGSGKSMLQGQVLGGIAKAGVPVCIASLEMKPERTIERIIRGDSRQEKPTPDDVFNYLQQTKDTLYLYDHRGTVESRRIVAMIRHCADTLKCKHIAIDSLMKCVKGEDDYNGQKDFVDALTRVAQDYSVHVHLVHHLRKSGNDSSSKEPSKMDIKGSGAITDLVDNVLILYRNKEKERAATPKHDDPDAWLICDKNRNGEWEGKTGLWFDKKTLRFYDYLDRHSF